MTREQAIYILRTLSGIMLEGVDEPAKLLNLTADDGVDLENIANALEHKQI